MPSFGAGDQAFLEGGAGDHGIQAWADAWALQVGSSPLTSAGYYIGLRARDSGLDTDPPGDFGQIIRGADGKKFAVGGPGGTFSNAPTRFFGNAMRVSIGNFADPGDPGLTFWISMFPNGSPTGSANTWPDGKLISDGAPSDSIGALIVTINCNGMAGDGSDYQVIIPDKSPLLGGAGDLAGYQWNFTFTLATSGKCSSGTGGGNNPPPPPVQSFAGIDLLCWKDGYHIAQAGPTLTISGRWHSDVTFPIAVIPSANIDTGQDCAEPRLSHAEDGPPLCVVYRRGIDTDAGIYRQESYDFGMTWRPDPEPNKPFLTGDNGLKHAVEVWNWRTGERLLFYNDQSAKDDKGNVTGQGAIKVNIYGPDIDPGTGAMRLVDNSPFAVTAMGTLADDSSFGAIYVRDIGAIDCAVLIGGDGVIYRSHDDGRTFQVIP